MQQLLELPQHIYKLLWLQHWQAKQKPAVTVLPQLCFCQRVAATLRNQPPVRLFSFFTSCRQGLSSRGRRLVEGILLESLQLFWVIPDWRTLGLWHQGLLWPPKMPLELLRLKCQCGSASGKATADLLSAEAKAHEIRDSLHLLFHLQCVLRSRLPEAPLALPIDLCRVTSRRFQASRRAVDHDKRFLRRGWLLTLTPSDVSANPPRNAAHGQQQLARTRRGLLTLHLTWCCHASQVAQSL
mmetsp:Transcript_45300/g.81930  ORF Transcript_45300/g.81930 Transcript_45300/m.81930 type:complete len:241 (+) Transcript_45300:664-1386(+)